MKTVISQSWVIVILISVISYVLFFGNLFVPNFSFWGSDVELKHFPARWYLFEQIMEYHRFPFWTERMFGGFAIYADSELGFLNIPNLIFLLIFGPELSMELLHFASYLVGSFSLYLLVKKFKYNLAGYMIANLIFFFNFFVINHSIHLNLILVLYLLPLNILFTDKLIEVVNLKNNRKTFLYSISLAVFFSYGLYWGSYQISALVVLSCFIYSLSAYSYKSRSMVIRNLLVFCFAGISSILLSLPQTIPTIELYLASKRFGDPINYFQGAISPSMLTTTIYPFVWGVWNNYRGKFADNSFSYTEMYVYIGVSVAFFSYISFSILKRDNISKFFYLSLLSFLIIVFFHYLPWIGKDAPFISSFRYWIRAIVILLLPLSLLIAKLVSWNFIERNNFKEIIKSNIYLIVPIVIVFALDKININKFFRYNMFKNVDYFSLVETEYGKIYIGLVISLLAIFGIFIFGVKVFKQHNHIRPIVIGLVIISIFVDYRVFGSDPLSARITAIRIPEVNTIPTESKTSRLLVDSPSINGIQGLYFDVWTIHGYSQFAPYEFVQRFGDLGINVGRLSASVIKIDPWMISEKLMQYGVAGYYDGYKVESLSALIPPSRYLSKIVGEASLINISEKEGHITFSVDTPEDISISTIIKDDEDMNVYINNEKAPTSSTHGLIEFSLPSGLNHIEIVYVPRLYYIGLIATGIYILALGVVYRWTLRRGEF